MFYVPSRVATTEDTVFGFALVSLQRFSLISFYEPFMIKMLRKIKEGLPLGLKPRVSNVCDLIFEVPKNWRVKNKLLIWTPVWKSREYPPDTKSGWAESAFCAWR